MDSDNPIKISLNIGGQSISLTVPFSRQDFARDVEKSVDSLYTQWRRAFPRKSDREVLTMVAYQFASHYHEMTELYARATEKAEQCLRLTEPEPLPPVGKE